MLYNGVLRGITSKATVYSLEHFERLCRGSKFTTTIHVINSAIVKLSKLTRVESVYRGISGRKLPPAFEHHDKHNAIGAVDLSFMSCTVRSFTSSSV